MTQEPQEAASDLWVGEYEAILEEPAGGLVYKPQFDCYVREYTLEQTDRGAAMLTQGQPKSWLGYHVPLRFRGIYHTADLPPKYTAGVDWRTNAKGYVLCTFELGAGSRPNRRGDLCTASARNRSGFCNWHGGMLHPLDRRQNWNEGKPGQAIGMRQLMHKDPSNYTRWEQLQAGIITVEDLDDEELARGMCRDRNGMFPVKAPSMVPKALHDQMMKNLLSRAHQKFREGLLGAIDALTHIATGDAYEAADRIKASSLIIDRVMGKTPDVVLTAATQAPWEQIFESISRDTGDSAYREIEAAIDAEVVEESFDADLEDEGDEGPAPGRYPVAQVVAEPTLEGEPISAGVAVGPFSSPPQDPDGRATYEAMLKEQESEPNVELAMPEKRAETAKELREKIKAGRARRYAARSRGLETTSNLPYDMVEKEVYPPTDDMLGLYRVHFVPPSETKVPAAVLAKEGRNRNYGRYS